MFYLNIARAVQGISAALFTPGSLALISATFQNEERGKAIGTWAGFAAITGAIGPLLGGWIAQYASWRDVFLINVPLAIIVLIIALRKIPESQETTPQQHIDILGAILICMSLGGITYARLGSQNVSSPWAQAAWLICSTIVFFVFLIWETRVQHPMMPLTYFRNRSFATLNVYTFILYAALGGSLFFVPFDLQNVQGYTPTAAGAAMLPFILILFVTSRWSGSLVGKIGMRTPLIVGACFAAAGFFGYSLIGIGGSYWTTFFPAACILGIGGTFFVTPLTTGVMSALDTHHAGIASGVNNTISRIAGLLAIAILGLLLSQAFYRSFDNKTLSQHLSPSTHALLEQQRPSLAAGRPPIGLKGSDAALVRRDVREAYTTGFRIVMRVSACLSGIAALIIAILLRNE